MIRRTKAQWKSLFSRFDKSGLSAAEFCLDNNLCQQYFSLRRKQLGTKKSERKCKPRFSKVKMSVASQPSVSHSECRIILPNGITVVVPSLLASDLLRQAMQLK